MNSLTQNYQNFKSYQKFHFVGIGGVSMSALALILKGMGKTVTGSDANDSEAQVLRLVLAITAKM